MGVTFTTYSLFIWLYLVLLPLKTQGDSETFLFKVIDSSSQPLVILLSKKLCLSLLIQAGEN